MNEWYTISNVEFQYLKSIQTQVDTECKWTNTYLEYYLVPSHYKCVLYIQCSRTWKCENKTTISISN